MGGPAALVVLVPVLGRPSNVGPLLASFQENTPDSARLLFVTSVGDTVEEEAIDAAGAERISIVSHGRHRGDYARKINAGYEQTDEPLIFLGADDLRFHPGWLEAAAAPLGGTVHVVGTNDLGNPRVLVGDHSTHSLVTRRYADRYGTIDKTHRILHEAYPHEFVDDEFIATAKSRDAFAFAEDSIVEHLHPHWGKAPTDPLYDAQRQRMVVGRRIYNSRRRLWAGRRR